MLGIVKENRGCGIDPGQAKVIDCGMEIHVQGFVYTGFVHRRIYHNREEDRQDKSHTLEPAATAAYNRVL